MSNMSKNEAHADLIPIQSFPIESQLCAQVLQDLATGTIPTHLLSSSPLNATDDAKAYQDITKQEHEHLLTVAFSILLDSTSPGPDPLALQSLGWAYGGGGGGGGMGDWNGCHYMPGPIGATLRVLQDQVALKLAEDLPLHKKYLDEGTWWLQDHHLEYGKGSERSATRFCTVGGIPPWVTPYDNSGIFWGPPLAGVCVPSSCTAKGLYSLFFEEVGFADKLLELSLLNGVYDESLPGLRPPTASRRFRYMNSLAQSFTAGKSSKMGLVCEGESGLKELDMEGYINPGYYVTVVFGIILMVAVLIGTLLSNINGREKKSFPTTNNKGDRMSFSAPPKTIIKAQLCEDQRSLATEKTQTTQEYGSMEETQNGLQNCPRLHAPQPDQMISSKTQDEICHREVKGKDMFIYSSSVNAINSAELCSNNVSKEATVEKRKQNSNFNTTSCAAVKSVFEYFDAVQSFYEITRMQRQKSSLDSLHEQVPLQSGELLLDQYNSRHGLLHALRESGMEGNICKETMSISSSRCLNGMRSISMLWIIFGHTLAVQSSIGYLNPAAVLPPTGMMSSTLGTIVLSARYAVDTFFFIGGYLGMSGLLKRLDPRVGQAPTTEEEIAVDRFKYRLSRLGIVNLKHTVFGDYCGGRLHKRSAGWKEEKGLKWIFPFLVHRVFRIIPTYGFVLLLWWKVAVTMGDGPFWPRWATLVALCDSHWWTNMLFVNNLVPNDQPFGETSECMYHAWYLGVDFQLCAVLTPIFVTLFLKKGWRKLTIALEILTVSIIIGFSMIFSYRYRWSANLFDGMDTLAFDRGFYINPVFRSMVYILGFVTAQIWHEKCRLCPNMGLTKIASVFLSLLSIILLLLIALGSAGTEKRPCLTWESPHTAECGSGWSLDKLAIFNSFARPAWGLGLSLISLLSFNGQLNALGSASVLTWAGWDPISRMSFSMYLMHPLVINIWVFGNASKFQYSHVNLFYAFAGIVAITFLAAVGVGILVEWPVSKITRDIEKYLWSSRCKQSQVQGNDEMKNLLHKEGKNSKINGSPA